MISPTHVLGPTCTEFTIKRHQRTAEFFIPNWNFQKFQTASHGQALSAAATSCCVVGFGSGHPHSLALQLEVWRPVPHLLPVPTRFPHACNAEEKFLTFSKLRLFTHSTFILPDLLE